MKVEYQGFVCLIICQVFSLFVVSSNRAGMGCELRGQSTFKFNEDLNRFHQRTQWTHQFEDFGMIFNVGYQSCFVDFDNYHGKTS